MIRASIKGIGFAIIIFSHLLVGAIIQILPLSAKRKINAAAHSTSLCAKLMLRVLQVKVDIQNVSKAIQPGKNYLIVSNHLSYVDILVVSSVCPGMFVTSVDTGEDWFLGAVCRMAGCYFVERRKRGGIKREIEKIGEILREGTNVIVFPEGTTSNGSSVMDFKPSLIATALHAKAEILPLCLNYVSLNGGPISAQNRDTIFWYGDMEFFPHVYELLHQKGFKARIQVLEAIPSDAAPDRKTLGRMAREVIAANYIQVS